MNETETVKTEPKFEPAIDSRGRAVPTLWVRNGRFYVCGNIPGKGSRRIPLYTEDNQPIRDLMQAVDAAALFRKQRQEGILPAPRCAPAFSEYHTQYITWVTLTEAKSPLTIAKEKSALQRWAKELGTTPVSRITRKMLLDYVAKRKESGKNNRTVNLDVIALGNLLRHAKSEGWIKGDVITEDFKWLKYTAPKRPLYSPEQIESLCTEALRTEPDEKGQQVPVYLYGQLFADWIHLMAFSGARYTAALTARWSNVDWKNRQISFRTKYDKIAVVDFNPKLEALLKDMQTRKVEGCDFLLPSPRSSRKEDRQDDGAMSNMNKTLEKVRSKVPGMADFSPHDCRHHFISYAVMDGVDFLTIAKWVAHSDGGVLIGKVYGHLSKSHMQQSASKLSFGAAPASQTSAPSQTAPEAKPGAVVDLTKISAADLLGLLQKLQGLAPQTPAPTPASQTNDHTPKSS